MDAGRVDAGIRRIEVVKVPIDVVPEEQLERVVTSFFDDGAFHQIVLLTMWDLMRARRNPEYRSCVRNASLVLPVSKGILRGARFLKKPVPHRYSPFGFTIRLLGILEKHRRSVYLLGGDRRNLEVSENNLRTSFPDLRIVGRYAGKYPSVMEANIILAIRKASPTLLLTGSGTKGRERWLYRQRNGIGSSIVLWCGDCFEVFAGRKRRVSRALFDRGLEFLPALVRRPWRVLRGFVYLYYGILLVVHRIFGR